MTKKFTCNTEWVAHYVTELNRLREICRSEKGFAAASELYDIGFPTEMITITNAAGITFKDKGRIYWNENQLITEHMARFVIKLSKLYRCNDEDLQIRAPDVPTYTPTVVIGDELERRYLIVNGDTKQPEPQLELEAEENGSELMGFLAVCNRLDAMGYVQSKTLQAAEQTNELLTQILNEIERGNAYAEKTGQELDAALSFLRTDKRPLNGVQ